MSGTKGRTAWVIDSQGYVHLQHPDNKTKHIAGKTLCRRPTKGMQRTFDRSLFCDCEACLDLIKMKHPDAERLP